MEKHYHQWPATYYLTFRMIALWINLICSHEGRTLETNSLQSLLTYTPYLAGDAGRSTKRFIIIIIITEGCFF